MTIWVPHNFQIHARDFMIDRPYAGVFLDPGLGKTAISYDVINHFREKTLVISPIRPMYSAWPGEKRKWDNFHNIEGIILHGPDKNRRFRIKNKGVYLINPEGIKWLIGMIERYKYFPWKTLIIDESSKWKSHGSVRLKKITPYLKLFTRRYILTGNPMPNSYMDLWSQIFILDGGRALGDSFYKFRNRYFTPADFKRWSWELKPGADEQIQAAIKSFVIHMAAEDYLELPKVIIRDIRFNLPPKVLKPYKQMEKQLFADVLEEKITAPSAASAVMKCSQICQGFMYETLDEVERELGKERRTFYFHDIKMEILKDTVDELQGSPLLVVYWFIEDLKRLRKQFPDAPIIGSGHGQGQRGVEIENEWNEGKHTILLAGRDSVSHGLNLQEGPGYNIFFYTLTYDFDKYDQLIKRLKRQGAKFDNVIVHRPIANNTVDEIQIATVEDKGKTQGAFLAAVKAYITKGYKG